MRPHCTKVCMFFVVTLFGILNVTLLVYFKGSYSLSIRTWSSELARGIKTAPWTKAVSDPALGSNTSGAQLASTTAVVGQQDGGARSRLQHHAGPSVSSSAQGVLKSGDPHRPVNMSADNKNVTRKGELQEQGEVLKAWGKVVRPRAGVAAPWKPVNHSVTLCPLVPPHLVGPLKIYEHASNWTEIVRLNPGLEPGGHYQPSQCRARHRVAVVIPYRNREEHLRILLHNLHPMLIRQQLDFFILVVELAQPTKFNRGMLLNIGAVEADGLWQPDCYIFHDVDLVPENDHNLYTCPQAARHMSAAVDKFGYRLPYNGIMGGVAAFSRPQFYTINGYSNLFFGWGGEDDDVSHRARSADMTIQRYPMNIARYRMIRHNRDKNNEVNPMRFKLLKTTKKRQPTDGLNSLQYQVLKVEFRPAYTWILVSVDKDQIMKAQG